MKYENEFRSSAPRFKAAKNEGQKFHGLTCSSESLDEACIFDELSVWELYLGALASMASWRQKWSQKLKVHVDDIGPDGIPGSTKEEKGQRFELRLGLLVAKDADSSRFYDVRAEAPFGQACTSDCTSRGSP